MKSGLIWTVFVPQENMCAQICNYVRLLVMNNCLIDYLDLLLHLQVCVTPVAYLILIAASIFYILVAMPPDAGNLVAHRWPARLATWLVG